MTDREETQGNRKIHFSRLLNERNAEIFHNIPSFVTSYAKCGNIMLNHSLLTTSVAAELCNICSLLQFNRSVIFITSRGSRLV